MGQALLRRALCPDDTGKMIAPRGAVLVRDRINVRRGYKNIEAGVLGVTPAQAEVWVFNLKQEPARGVENSQPMRFRKKLFVRRTRLEHKRVVAPRRCLGNNYPQRLVGSAD